jgi:hypothetical protein
MVSFGLLILFILYFAIREIASMVQQRLAYWSTYWAYAEWGIILGITDLNCKRDCQHNSDEARFY